MRSSMDGIGNKTADISNSPPHIMKLFISYHLCQRNEDSHMSDEAFAERVNAYLRKQSPLNVYFFSTDQRANSWAGQVSPRLNEADERSFDHRTMRICFEELRRAARISLQPNFLTCWATVTGSRPLAENSERIRLLQRSLHIVT